MAGNSNNTLDGLYTLAKSGPTFKDKAKAYILDIIGTITATAIAAWDDITGKPSTFPPDTHTHVEADITDLGSYVEEAPIDGTPYARQDAGWVAASSGSYTDEEAQDAVGNVLTDTTTINFTYTDATPTIEANVKDSSITEGMQVLADNTTHDVSITAHGYVPKAPNSTTQFLRGDATWAIPIAEWTIVNKTAIETIQSDNTLSNDSALQFSTTANTTYLIEIWALFASTAAADFQYTLSHSGTTTVIDYYEQRAHATGANGSGTLATYPYNTSPQTRSLVLATTMFGALLFKIYLEVGASSGTFGFQWAQVTSNASDTSIKPGSYLKYKIFS